MQNFPSIAELVASPAVAIAVTVLFCNFAQSVWGLPKRWVGLIVALALVVGGNLLMGQTAPIGLANALLTGLLVYMGAVGGNHLVASFLDWRNQPAQAKRDRSRAFWAEW